MTPTKGDVKNWLKAIGKDRDWLARECGTEKGTVNNWLSPSGPFPSNAILKIHSLMSQYGPAQPENEAIQTNRLVLEITEERMRKYERAASEKGSSPAPVADRTGGPSGGRAPAPDGAKLLHSLGGTTPVPCRTCRARIQHADCRQHRRGLPFGKRYRPVHHLHGKAPGQKRIRGPRRRKIHGTPHPGRRAGSHAAPYGSARPEAGNHRGIQRRTRRHAEKTDPEEKCGNRKNGTLSCNPSIPRSRILPPWREAASPEYTWKR